MTHQSASDRYHGPRRFLTLLVALVVVVSGLAVGLSAAATARPADTTSGADLGEVVTDQENVSIHVNCNASEVRVTAPDQFGYLLRVSNVVVTPDRSETLSTTTTESGNATVPVGESGLVYAFVSTDTGLAASAFENCALADAQANETTTTPEPGATSATVDCNASEVRVEAPAELSYDVRVSNIVATPQSTRISSTGLSASGNTTVSIGDAGAVAVFVTNETGTIVSAFENCESTESNRTTTESRQFVSDTHRHEIRLSTTATAP